MRILILQFAPEKPRHPLPRFDPSLGVMITLLQQRDHELALCGLSRYDQAAIKSEMARMLPQLVYADISAVCTDAARRTLQYIHDHEFLTVVAGGQYATVAPQNALSLPAVHAVAIGEPDASLVTYLERAKDPAVGQVVSGVWLRDERGLARPGMPSLIEDLDSLPFPERDLFKYGEHVHRTGEIEIAVGRGCPQSCAYCINDRVESLYDEESGSWVRRRSPGNVLEEIDLLRNRYEGVRSVRFLDHGFALDNDWLREFLDAYKGLVGAGAADPPGDSENSASLALPFRCHLRANSATAEVVERLAAAGCRLVDVELISGSDFVRNEIFDMNLDGEQIAATFELLRAHSIGARVIVYPGAPYESEASLDETRDLLRSIKPDAADIRAYYPWPGTRAREVAEENGFVKKLRHEFPSFPGESRWRRWTLPKFGR
jgi:radical SAM superfamily enzyme YgiQ (UPF0313 family)